jgi:hypothetical protein
MKVINLECRNGDGRALRAFADVEFPEFGGLILRSFRIILQGGRAAVQCPQTTIKQPDKPAFFKTLVFLPEPYRQDVELAILGAWKEALARQKEKQNGNLQAALETL